LAYGFLDHFMTPGVRAAQAANGASELWAIDRDRPGDRLGPDEAAFIAARDSFYLASVAETGWPYVQHRGGPPGFVKALDETHLAFPDFRGNRQYISLGNVSADDRVAMIMVDYPHQARLKILARLRVADLAQEPDLAERLALPGYRGRPERAFVLTLSAFDWNCAQHITPRYTVLEIDAALRPLQERLGALEAENAALRRKLAQQEPRP
jgi:predicted pyridoxine 5'-phosphate oxidase superfamily flavin-nucleotide-binding protein